MFVDYLTVRQVHRQAPLWAESQLLSYDLETGEVDWSVYTGRTEEGSYSSKLRIRSDGQTVEVSGNPSRWNREENLFGVRSVDAALQVFNAVLEGLGLPAFYEDESTRLTPRLLQRSDSLMRDGCELLRVDVTENYSTGGPRNSEQALHSLRSFRHRNRAPVDYGTTLMWGQGSGYTTMKYYLKGPEMRAHRKRKSWSPYLQQVLDFVEAEGLVRFEVTCKARFLRRSGLDRPGAWDDDVMRAILEGYAVHDKATTNASSMHDIAAALRNQGLSARRAEHCQAMALAYMSGHNLRSGISRATFYRLRRDLLLVGIDISADLNISSLRFKFEPIKMQPTAMPEWYRAA